MKKYVLCLLLSVLSLSVSAFEYHGIKSGMLKSEVEALIKCEYSQCGFEDAEPVKLFFGGEKSTPPSFWGMKFSYTSDLKLWKIALSFRTRSAAAGVAQVRILTGLYPDAELQNTTTTIYSTSIDIVVAQLIDTPLFLADIEKLYEAQKGSY